MSSFCFDDAPGIVLLITTLMIGQVLFEAPLISTKIIAIHAPSGIRIPVHTWELGMVYRSIRRTKRPYNQSSNRGEMDN